MTPDEAYHYVKLIFKVDPDVALDLVGTFESGVSRCLSPDLVAGYYTPHPDNPDSKYFDLRRFLADAAPDGRWSFAPNVVVVAQTIIDAIAQARTLMNIRDYIAPKPPSDDWENFVKSIT